MSLVRCRQLGDTHQTVLDVTQHADRHSIMFVHFGLGVVYMDDAAITRGVPEVRMILNQVIADA